jgi:hypothetical protein
MPFLLKLHLPDLFDEVTNSIEFLAIVPLVMLDGAHFSDEFAKQPIGRSGVSISDITGGHSYARPWAKGGG